MSKIKLTGHSSGSGVITLIAPNTSTDRTISLPDSTGTILDTTSGLDATKLSGNLPALNGASLTGVNAINSGKKNIIINGGMRINQRGAGSLTINSGSLQYPCDRFAARGVSSAGVFTIEKVTDSPAGFTNSLKATVTTADSSLSGTESYRIVQHIEGNNTSYLNWGSSDNQTATLSFKVKSSLTGTFGGVVQNGDYNRFVPFTYTISSANTWEDKTVTITGDTTGTYQTDTALAVRLNWSLGAAQLGTAGTYSGSALNGATGQTQVISTNGATWQVTGVQLELGSVATDFENRSYGEELALCQRYFERFDYDVSGGGFGAIAGQCHSAIKFYGVLVYNTTKRTDPSISNSTLSGSNFRILHTGTTTNVTETAYRASKSGSRADVAVASGLTVGNAGIMDTGSSQGQYIDIDAEL